MISTCMLCEYLHQTKESFIDQLLIIPLLIYCYLIIIHYATVQPVINDNFISLLIINICHWWQLSHRTWHLLTILRQSISRFARRKLNPLKSLQHKTFILPLLSFPDRLSNSQAVDILDFYGMLQPDLGVLDVLLLYSYSTFREPSNSLLRDIFLETSKTLFHLYLYISGYTDKLVASCFTLFSKVS